MAQNAVPGSPDPKRTPVESTIFHYIVSNPPGGRAHPECLDILNGGPPEEPTARGSSNRALQGWQQQQTETRSKGGDQKLRYDLFVFPPVCVKMSMIPPIMKFYPDRDLHGEGWRQAAEPRDKAEDPSFDSHAEEPSRLRAARLCLDTYMYSMFMCSLL